MARKINSKYFGQKETGALLAELRKCAGFPSAAAAAAAFGWSASTLAAHEGGRRRIAPLDAERYSLVFGCESQAFQDPAWAVRKLEELSGEAAQQKLDIHERTPFDVGRRLTLARRVRGFKRRSSACAIFGLPRPTLTAHELGVSTIPGSQGRIYAKAYGISLDWLTNGILPSGLGAAVDQRLRSDPNPSSEEADRLAELADRYAAPDRTALNALKAFVREGSGGLIREVVLDYECEAGISEPDRAPRLWSLPEDYDRHWLGARAEDIVVVPNGKGGRFFIDASDQDIQKGGHFLYVDAESRPAIVAQPRSEKDSQLTSDERLVGRLLAEINVYRRS